jgi:hypothetical protein
MSKIVVESSDLYEWGEVLSAFGLAVTISLPQSTAGQEIKKIGDHLTKLSQTAPLERKLS